MASEKKRQRVVRRQASVGKGKAELFPFRGVSGSLNLQGRFGFFRNHFPSVFTIMDLSMLTDYEESALICGLKRKMLVI